MGPCAAVPLQGSSYRFRSMVGGAPAPARPSVCGACGSPLPERDGRGRVRAYCDPACRMAAYRRRAAGL